MYNEIVQVLEDFGKYLFFGFVLSAFPALFGVFINFALNLFRK